MFKSSILVVFLIQSFLHKSRTVSIISNTNLQILQPCLAQDWVNCGIKVATTYFSLHRWNDAGSYNLALSDGNKYQCNASVKGGFHKRKWRYTAHFSCPTLSSIVGTSDRMKGRSGAVENALQNYFIKIGQAGIITEKTAKALAKL